MLKEKYTQLIRAIACCVGNGKALLKSDLYSVNALLIEAEKKIEIEQAG